MKDKLRNFTKNKPIIDSFELVNTKPSMFSAPKLSIQQTKDTSGTFMLKKFPPGTRTLNNLKWEEF